MKSNPDWTYNNKVVKSKYAFPDDAYGFVYIIHNVSKNKYYIGKKSLYSRTNVTIAKSTYDKNIGNPMYHKTKNKSKSRKGSPVWVYKKHVVKETNWLTYTGSNKELNEDIKKGDQIEKIIVDVAFNSRELTYLETKHLFNKDVLENDNYYNSNILGKFFKSKK